MWARSCSTNLHIHRGRQRSASACLEPMYCVLMLCTSGRGSWLGWKPLTVNTSSPTRFSSLTSQLWYARGKYNLKSKCPQWVIIFMDIHTLHVHTDTSDYIWSTFDSNINSLWFISITYYILVTIFNSVSLYISFNNRRRSQVSGHWF